MKINYEMTAHETGLEVVPRPSHVMGQLLAAAQMIGNTLVVQKK